MNKEINFHFHFDCCLYTWFTLIFYIYVVFDVYFQPFERLASLHWAPSNSFISLTHSRVWNQPPNRKLPSSTLLPTLLKLSLSLSLFYVPTTILSVQEMFILVFYAVYSKRIFLIFVNSTSKLPKALSWHEFVYNKLLLACFEI